MTDKIEALREEHDIEYEAVKPKKNLKYRLKVNGSKFNDAQNFQRQISIFVNRVIERKNLNEPKIELQIGYNGYDGFIKDEVSLTIIFKAKEELEAL
jgi:hypothetical protein